MVSRCLPHHMRGRTRVILVCVIVGVVRQGPDGAPGAVEAAGTVNVLA
jgi:hypothetical protein